MYPSAPNARKGTLQKGEGVHDALELLSASPVLPRIKPLAPSAMRDIT